VTRHERVERSTVTAGRGIEQIGVWRRQFLSGQVLNPKIV
jgi:hypothetical protein